MKITKKIEELFGYAQQVIDGFLNLCKTTDLPKAVGEAASTALTVLREKDAEFRVALTLALNLDAALAEVSSGRRVDPFRGDQSAAFQSQRTVEPSVG